MKPRNARDSGIYEEGQGRFRVAVSTGRKGKGYGQVVRYVRGTKSDARKLRDQLRADVSRSVYIAPAREPLAAWLDKWLERIMPPHGSIKVATWKSYEIARPGPPRHGPGRRHPGRVAR